VAIPSSSSITSGSPVSLDSFVFTDFASPTTIRRGARQSLKVHKLLGGKRYVQAMGSDPANITWTGAFYGSDALSNSYALEAFCDGQSHTLSWTTANFNVVVESIDFEEEDAGGHIQYTITCVILNVVTSASPTTTALQSAQADTNAANAVTLPAALPSVSTPLSGAMQALSAVGAQATDALSSLKAVQAAIADPISAAESVIATAGNLADTISTTAARTAMTSLGSALATVNTLAMVANPVGRAIQTISGL
jgi:hypothetical protein